MRLGKYAVLACFMMAMGFAAAQVQAAVPKAYWKFEGGTNQGLDYTGNGYNATLMGDATISPIRPTAASMNGQTTGSLMLSGTGYCQVANPAGLTIGQANFSLAFWYRCAGVNNTLSMAIFSKSNNGIGVTGAKFFGINGGGGAGKLSYDNWGSGGSYYGAKTTMHDGNWHHVVLTQRARTAFPTGASETLKVYVDGAVPVFPPVAGTPDINTSQTTVLDTAMSGTPNPTIAIGLGPSPTGTTNGGNFNFIGWIDDMKFFDVCLSPADVQQEYGKNTSGVSSITVTPLTAGNVVFPTISTITGPTSRTVNVLVKNNNATGFSPLEFKQQTATDALKGMVITGTKAARYTLTNPTTLNWNTVGLAPQATLIIPVKFTPVFGSDFNPLVDSTCFATLSLYTNINGTPKYDIPLTGPLVPVGMSSFSAK